MATGVLGTLWLAPPASRPFAQLLYLLLGAYGGFAFWALFFLHGKPHRFKLPPLMTHAVDILVAATVTLAAGDTNVPVFVLFLFPLLAAATRWGFPATVATGCATVLMLLAEALLLAAIVQSPVVFGLDRLAGFSVCVLVAAAAAGYLAQTEKQFQSEIGAIASIMSSAGARAGLSQTMALVFEALLRHFHARRALLVVYETDADRLFLWDGTRSATGSVQAADARRLEPRHLGTFMFEPAAAAWYGARRRGARGECVDVVALDHHGTALEFDPWILPQEFLDLVQPFDRVMAVGVEVADEWKGRLWLVDPIVGADRVGALTVARRLVRQIVPAVHNIYLLRRVRAAAYVVERARFARELHDGVIQGVLGVQMQVSALTRRLAGKAPGVVAELARLDGLLQEEVVNLRELMQQKKSIDLSADELVDALADSVQRFERETGIRARFITQLDRVPLAPRACREVARILNEALINVRRHSGASNVSVRLGTVNGDCRLSIADDGRGFPFAGRMTPTDLATSRKGPLVIKERVRLLGGHLTIESEPGRGALLEIAVPLASHAMEA